MTESPIWRAKSSKQCVEARRSSTNGALSSRRSVCSRIAFSSKTVLTRWCDRGYHGGSCRGPRNGRSSIGVTWTRRCARREAVERWIEPRFLQIELDSKSRVISFPDDFQTTLHCVTVTSQGKERRGSRHEDQAAR